MVDGSDSLAVLSRWLKGLGKPKERYFAACEYWVYLPSDEMPPQDDLMRRLLAENPHGPRAFGKAEGLVFSDVRLHVAVVRREKNPHAFRPDLFDLSVKPTAEILEKLAAAKSFAKLRFVAEEPLADRRHIQFLVCLADAVAQLGGGTVVFDAVGERLMLPNQLYLALQASPDATGSELHLQTLWKLDGAGGSAETRGLIKIGMPELVTYPITTDQQVLAMSLVEQAAAQLWSSGTWSDRLTVSAFDDEFELVASPEKDHRAMVRILRRQTG